MTILFSALAVTFGALCVWLTVRIINRRERWAEWITLTLALVVGVYPMSWGPAIWALKQCGDPEWAVSAYHIAYAPLFWLSNNGPEPVRNAIEPWP